MNRWRIATFAAASLLGAACTGGIGDECGTLASESECTENAVCSERDACPAGEPDCGVVGRCRQICNDDRDCPDDGSCEDVRDSSFKSCIPPR